VLKDNLMAPRTDILSRFRKKDGHRKGPSQLVWILDSAQVWSTRPHDFLVSQSPRTKGSPELERSLETVAIHLQSHC
jgi:hypothetical protein